MEIDIAKIKIEFIQIYGTSTNLYEKYCELFKKVV